MYNYIDSNTKLHEKLHNFILFDANSKINSRLHHHDLKYVYTKEKWECNICLRKFDKEIESFNCNECHFNLCRKCFLTDEENLNNKNDIIKIKYKMKYDNYYKLLGDKFYERNRNILKLFFNKKEISYLVDSDVINQDEFEIEIKGINNITNMSNMFEECRFIKYLDLSNLDLSKASYMKFMFYNCINLKEIKGLNRLKNKNVKNVASMFNNCTNLEYIDLSNFDFSNVTDISSIFNECYRIKDIKGINNLVNKNIDNTHALFYECRELEYLNLSQFDTLM